MGSQIPYVYPYFNMKIKSKPCTREKKLHVKMGGTPNIPTNITESIV